MQCMGTLYVDAGGQVYGAVVEDCPEPFADVLLRKFANWTFEPGTRPNVHITEYNFKQY